MGDEVQEVMPPGNVPAPAAPPLITVERVSKTYQAAAGNIAALHHVSLTIGRGEFLSLIGPSGCGKSTLIRLIGDLDTPESGTITVKGKTPQQARLDRDYGIVFQSPVLYEWRTVRKNIELPLELLGYRRKERQQRAMEMLRLVELDGFQNAFPWQLSGGMQQRVAIARALSFNPSILMMDEPFGALDELTRERMQDELLKLWGSNQGEITVIFVTHSISEAVFLSDRVVVMSPRPGRIERVVPIDLPRPRDTSTRDLPRFYELVSEVRGSLRD